MSKNFKINLITKVYYFYALILKRITGLCFKNTFIKALGIYEFSVSYYILIIFAKKFKINQFTKHTLELFNTFITFGWNTLCNINLDADFCLINYGIKLLLELSFVLHKRMHDSIETTILRKLNLLFSVAFFVLT